MSGEVPRIPVELRRSHDFRWKLWVVSNPGRFSRTLTRVPALALLKKMNDRLSHRGVSTKVGKTRKPKLLYVYENEDDFRAPCYEYAVFFTINADPALHPFHSNTTKTLTLLPLTPAVTLCLQPSPSTNRPLQPDRPPPPPPSSRRPPLPVGANSDIFISFHLLRTPTTILSVPMSLEHPRGTTGERQRSCSAEEAEGTWSRRLKRSSTVVAPVRNEITTGCRQSPPSDRPAPATTGHLVVVAVEDMCGVEHVGLSVLQLEVYIAVESTFNLIVPSLPINPNQPSPVSSTLISRHLFLLHWLFTICHQPSFLVAVMALTAFSTTEKATHNSHKFGFTLSPTNYGYWKALIQPFLVTNNLFGYIDGTIPCPESTKSTEKDTTPTTNPSYLALLSNDAHIRMLLMSTISEAAFQHVQGTTSRDVWLSLERAYAPHTSSREYTLKTQLLKIEMKGDESSGAYLTRAQEYSAALANIGKPMPETDLVMLVISGLREEYTGFKSTLLGRESPIAFNDLYGLLADHDYLIKKNTSPLPAAQAFAAATLHRPSSVPPETLQSLQQLVAQLGFQLQPTSPQVFYTNRSGNNHSNRSRGNSNNNNRSRGGRSGYNNRPQGDRPQGGGNRSQFSWASNQNTVYGTCNRCGIGHVPSQCPNRDPSTLRMKQPSANYADYQSQTSTSTSWLPDTGSTSHVAPDLSGFDTSEPYYGEDNLHVGNGKGLPILHIGSKRFYSPHKTFSIKNILHVPDIKKHLLSVQQFCHDNDVFFEFHSSFFAVKDESTHNTLLTGPSDGGLYTFRLPAFQPLSKVAFSSTRTSSTIWHQRLGHPHSQLFKFMLSKFHLPVSNNSLNSPCNSCFIGKSSKLHLLPSDNKSSHVLDLLFCDVWGPAPTTSYDGHNYFLFSGDCLPTKFPISPSRPLKLPVPTAMGQKRSKIKIDLTEIWVVTFFSSLGIIHRVSCPHTSEQNGTVERRHRHVVEIGLTLLAQSNVPKRFWDFAFETAVYLINRMPSRTTTGTSPFELLLKRKPDLSFLRVFGCQCYPHLRPYNAHKMDFRSTSCVFLGYSTSNHGYRCFDPSSDRIYIARHVRFNEHSFPFTSNLTPTPFSTEPYVSVYPDPHNIPPSTPPSNNLNKSTPPNDLPTPPPPTASSEADPQPAAPPLQTYHRHRPPSGDSQQPLSSAFESFQQSAPVSAVPATETPPPAAPTPPQPPASTASTPAPTRPRPAHLRQHLKPPKPFSHGLFHTHINPPVSEPTPFSVANKDPHWRHAMAEEYSALLRNGTWTLVPPPSRSNVVDCKWVYKIKRDQTGAVTRYKARLVAKGFNQQPGIDYTETFSPVVKSTTIRVVLSLAVTKKWPLRQLDIQNAFLHGDLQETVYLRQPPGFVDAHKPDHVCHLHKSLYGLKQAPRAWFQRLSSALLALGFRGSKTDPSLFTYCANGTLLYMLVYVDDIILTGNNSDAIDRVVHSLSKSFALQDMGPLSYFLGIEVQRHGCDLLLSQRKYIMDLVERAKLSKSKSVPSPMTTTANLALGDSPPFHDPVQYRQLVGALQYVTLSRPDITYAVNKACQFMHSPTENHWTAVKRILRYLHGTSDHGLRINHNSDAVLHAYTDAKFNSLSAFSDADWAGCPDDRRSTGGFAICLGSNLVSWSARKQKTASRSSTESEYKALADTVAELTWLEALLRELQIPIPAAPNLWCDNLGATYLSANPVFHARTNHVEVDFHFVREKVAEGRLSVQFISTHDQIADVFTKPLAVERFLFLKSKLRGKYSKLYHFWTLSVVCDKHNHEPAEHFEGHAFVMRLSDNETRLVADLTRLNVKPHDILTTLKEQNPENVSTLKTIYNARDKIKMNEKAGVPLPLDLIHVFWRKLNLHPSVDSQVDDEAQMFTQNNPTIIREPVVQIINRGRPSSKKKTFRNSRATQPPNDSYRDGCPNTSESYINQFPYILHLYISNVHDVQADGNCGFRAIAACLGLHEDNWSRIRADLLEELDMHQTEYDDMFGSQLRFEIYNSLNFFRSDIQAPYRNWMTLPETGILVASRYNVILHSISNIYSTIYFPLWSTPPPMHEQVAIAIGFVNNNHYVRVILREEYPMPPVYLQWNRYKRPQAAAWITPYIDRINSYADFINSNRNF
ncbi:hypothetical protein LXL04_025120 [Taraxacum kok-saghyz]